MPTENDMLIERVRRGEAVAAETVIERFYPRIYASLRRLTSNEADAADLTQKTFGKLWHSLSTFGGKSTLGSWLHSIAYHVYVDWRRSHHRSEPRTEEWLADQPDPGPLPDEIAARKDLAARLYAGVDRLPADHRETVHLHYYQALTLHETAEVMGVATSTVK
jgi:RNA polymerase sigma-70 factor (ECF subfamily)